MKKREAKIGAKMTKLYHFKTKNGQEIFPSIKTLVSNVKIMQKLSESQFLRNTTLDSWQQFQKYSTPDHGDIFVDHGNFDKC